MLKCSETFFSFFMYTAGKRLKSHNVTLKYSTTVAELAGLVPIYCIGLDKQKFSS